MADLIDRDEVKRELNAQYAVAKNTANPDSVEQVLRAVSKFFDSFPTVNHWIPVEDALPEVWKEVLVVLNINGYQSICIGEMQESGDWMVSGEFWYDKGDPALTHWMPMPSTEGLT